MENKIKHRLPHEPNFAKPEPFIMGIDPGFSGGIALLSESDLIVTDIPIVKYLKKKEVDAEAFSRIVEAASKRTLFAIIEDVHSMPNQGVASTFKFGYNAGILYGVLKAFGIQVIKVKPAIWKSGLNLSRNKKESIFLAKKLFPCHTEYFKRAKDDGRAEAALLAHFGKKHFCAAH